MRRRRRVNGEAPRIADIGDVVEHLQAVDELGPSFLAALQAPCRRGRPRRRSGTLSARALSDAGLLAWMDDCLNRRMVSEPIGDSRCVLAMAFHAERQRLQALDELECVERAHSAAKVAQQRCPRLDDVGDRANALDGLGPYGAMVAGVRLVQVGLALRDALPNQTRRYQRSNRRWRCRGRRYTFVVEYTITAAP